MAKKDSKKEAKSVSEEVLTSQEQENEIQEKESKKKEQKNKQEKINGKEKQEDNKEKKDSSEEHDKKEKSVGSKEKEEEKKEEKPVSEEEKLKAELEELNNKYLRLSAEFDNYRKRTLKEKIEMAKTAGEEVLLDILPVMDNFERAINSIEDSKDIDAIKEGILLIYNKFKEFLEKKGIKEIESDECELNTDVHEAVTKIPAPDERLKGKIVDTIEKGYYLKDKVIRYAKVVVGE